ncbi:ChiQ/YbfN family lipoprotein [Citrobacter sp. FP75]|uniref:ChiQ/YbfN family lipoprotein n=1 Tax=Citrobacter sp. FP75 TaxID=1852949 RepID=UPI001BC9A1D5|nr:ChiQ/YbfN family lipoprotein [Citrobacter sp. FP75]
MKKYLPVLAALFLAGCASSSPAPQIHDSNDPLSPMAYQECIQAAMTGNGQAYNEKCDKILKETR